jgi:hypothetical protein
MCTRKTKNIRRERTEQRTAFDPVPASQTVGNVNAEQLVFSFAMFYGAGTITNSRLRIPLAVPELIGALKGNNEVL